MVRPKMPQIALAPQFTPAPAESWWVGKSREELAAKVREEQNRLRHSKGSQWVSGLSFEGSTTSLAKFRKAGGL